MSDSNNELTKLEANINQFRADTMKAEIERLQAENELLRLNLCPHALRYGRTCDDGPTDEEVENFLRP